MRLLLGMLLYVLFYLLANLLAGWLTYAHAESPPLVPAVQPDGLLDPGPRLKLAPDDPASIEFEQAIRTWIDGRPADAEGLVRSLLARRPDGPIAAACRALLIELSLVRDARREALRDAIEAYRRLIGDSPDSEVAARARWRMGDLSEMLGLHEEAQAAYGLVLAGAADEFDRRRARLGRGVSLMAAHRASEAERDFRLLLQERSDDLISRQATIGLADSLQAQNRSMEAMALYDHASARWPELLRLRPGSLFHYAEAAAAVGREADSRWAYLTAFNIHARRPDSLLALLKVGDSFRRQGDRHHAGFFYDYVIQAAHDPTVRATATVRKADLGLELLANYRGDEVEWEVQATVVRHDSRFGSPEEQRRTLEAVAAAHDAQVISSEALFRLARRAEIQGTTEETLRAYRRVIERQGRLSDDPWPQAARERLRRLASRKIAEAAASGDDLGVVTSYRAVSAAVGSWDGDQTVLLQVAAAWARLGLTTEAINLYRDLSETAAPPIREEALLALGTLYLDQADYQAARTVLARYRLEFPLGRRTPEASRLLATALDRTGEHGAAARLLRQWLKRFPTHPDRATVRRMLAAELAAAGQVSDSLRAYAEAERAGALNDPAELMRYAETLAGSRRYDDAIARLRRVAQEANLSAQREWALLQIAKLERTRGRPSAAKAALRELHATTSDLMVKRAAAALLAGLAG